MTKLKASPLPGLETDLAALDRRRTLLEARSQAAVADHAAAIARRRALLVEADDPDPKALTAADRAVRDALDAREAATDALGAIDASVTVLRTRIDRIRVNERRQADAAELEAQAKEVDAILGRVAQHADAIDKERQALAALMTERTIGCYEPPERYAPGIGAVYLSPRGFDAQHRPTLADLASATIAARLVEHVLAPVLPSLGLADAEDAMRPHPGLTCTPVLGIVEDGVVSKAILTDRMRELAGEVRRGTDMPEPTEKDVKAGERDVFVLEPCHYRDGKLPPRILTAWHQTVPVPVADRMLELGLCVSPKSAEAERFVEAKRQRDDVPYRPADHMLTAAETRDLGIDMAVWRTAELARLRAVWRAGLPS